MYKARFQSKPVAKDDMLMGVMTMMFGVEDNELLSSIPLAVEVEKTLRSMNLMSAPGPNGFSGLFYHTCWEIVKEDTIRAV